MLSSFTLSTFRLSLFTVFLLASPFLFAQSGGRAIVRFENMTKVPGTQRGFPAEDFFTFHRSENPVNSVGQITRATDRHTLRIHNDGDAPLTITQLTTTSTVNFRITGVSVPSSGLQIAPGSHLDATVVFVAKGGPKRLITERLKLSSNAANAATVSATFRGAYMQGVEGGNEINAQQVFEAFGFKTRMGRDNNGNLITRPSSDYPSADAVDAGKEGDLIVSRYFVPADPSKPVRIVQLSALHGPGGAITEFRNAQNNHTGKVIYHHGSLYHQTLLPRASNSSTVIAGKATTSLTVPFQLKIDGYGTWGGTSSGERRDELLAVRSYLVIDRNGEVIPNEYILNMDYIGGSGCGVGSANCDWNDNTTYLINARPVAVPTAAAIEDLTARAEHATVYAVNGAFNKGYPGNKLTYTAALAGGGRLPRFVVLDQTTGVFTIDAPAAEIGKTYQIRVKGTDYNGLTATADFTLRVADRAPDVPTDTGADGNNTPPTAIAAATPTRGSAPLTVQLDATASTDADGSIVSYAWNWTNGAAAGARPQLVLPQGEYAITLTVRDEQGATTTDVVTVSVGPQRPPLYRSFWLEAECAQVGGRFTVKSTTAAAGGRSVIATATSMTTAPTDIPDNRVRFTITNAALGYYNLFARISAPDTKSDSYWVRVNDKAWYKWGTGIVKGQGFRWNKLPGAQLFLAEGTNTIDFAYREPNVQLDKLHLDPQNDFPTGPGGPVTNCGEVVNQLPVARATANPRSGAAPLNVRLDASSSTDADGRIISYAWTWEGGSATGITPRAIFESGTYRVTLTVTDERGGTATSGLTITAGSGDPAPPTTPEAPEAPSSPEALPTTFWLEAECAEAGTTWTTAGAAGAANGKYVVVRSGNSTSTPPSDVAANRVRFSVRAGAGNYRLFARITAPSNLDDSYWVRLNGGNWYKWSSGLEQGGQFAWNKYPGGTLALREGDNTVDFAYREDGAGLDKIYLTTSTTPPSGTGGNGTNCVPVTEPTEEGPYHELECATVGSGWQRGSSRAASGGTFIAFSGERRTSAPAQDDAAELIILPIELATAGRYRLYLHLDAPDPSRNSIWVQVDRGAWIKFWEEVGGAQLLTAGFEWREVNTDGQPLSFNLAAGSHTLRIANREPGTRLDKVHFSLRNRLPVGIQNATTNCRDTQAVMAAGNPDGVARATEEPAYATEVEVFPNPTDGQLRLEVRSDFTGSVTVLLYDSGGRRVQERYLDKQNEVLTSRLDLSDLAPGMYRVCILEGDRMSVHSAVRR